MRARTSVPRLLGWVALLAAATGPGLRGAAPPPAAPPPRVLLITLDTTRADRLGCYGSTRGLTPALDAFARGATLFERCTTPAPMTGPAHVSLLSGWNPARHGLRQNLETHVGPGVPLLAPQFRDAGYETGAFVSAMVLLGHYGLGRGFDTYDDRFYDRRRPESVERRAGETLERAQSWIASRKGPWFCWVHLFDPHWDYAPPEPWAQKYRAEPYDGEVAYMDAALGQFLEALGRAGALEGTVVVICGDHGESLGEHGEAEHDVFLYDATVRVPLMVRVPGQGAPRRVGAGVGLVDVAATLRELCRLPAVAGDGVSLAGALGGAAPTRGPVFAESMEPLYGFGWAPLFASVEGGKKFVLAPRPEYYDLAADPREGENLYARHRSDAALMRAPLAAYLEAVHPPGARPADLPDEELRSLQSLGYIGSGGRAPAAPSGGYRDPKDGAAVLGTIQEGIRLKSAGRTSEAEGKFRQALKADPGNATLHYFVGECLQARDPEAAAAAFRKALKCRPDFPQAYLHLTDVLGRQGRHAEALAVGRMGLEKTDDYSGMLGTLTAWAAARAGRPAPEVLALLEGAAARGPERGLSFKLRALLALRAGDTEASLKQLEAMAAVSPPFLMQELGEDSDFAPLREDPRFWRLVLAAGKRGGAPR